MARFDLPLVARSASIVTVLAACAVPSAHAAGGARSFKTGPIQITADGSRVWVANREHGSVSSIDTSSLDVAEHPTAGCKPQGVSVREDGDELWVTCPEQDEVRVLSGIDATELARIALPHGSGPAFVALSPSQALAIVTLQRGDAIAVIDAASRTLAARLPSWRAPLGAAWARDGRSAWVDHAASDGVRTFVSRVDVSGGVPRVGACLPIGMQEPQQSTSPSSVGLLAEGGAVTFRGHVAQLPASSGSDTFWLPSQHAGINDTYTSSDTAIQAAVHVLEPASATISPSSRLVLTAVQAHDAVPQPTMSHPGWNAHVSGFIDIAFSADGDTAYLLGESSEDILVVPTSIAPWKGAASDPGLLEIPVGQQPTGIAISPREDVAYVYDAIDRSVMVIQLRTQVRLATVATAQSTTEPLSFQVLLGRRIFASSVPREASGNQKVACASCHAEGEQDGLVWHFEHLPTPIGPRPTTSMLGLSLTFGPGDPATGLGQLHRSGDRNEIQDFEHTFRGVQMGGTGFFVAPPNPYSGPPNAGESPQVDAMAAYMLSLPPLVRSPHRSAGGELTPAGVRGAGIFRGAAGLPGDAGCATCHAAATGFVDKGFHDVGSAHPPQERQISARLPTWKVNTPTLIGLWATAPYDDAGSDGDQDQDLVDALRRFGQRDATPAPHGHVSALTRRQLDDLATFVLSIDGSTTPSEVSSAADTQPPRLVRAEPVSMTRIACWFDESVDPGSAGSPANWRVVRDDGTEVRVVAAEWDATWGDRVTLRTDPLPRDCSGRSFTVVPAAIFDAAGSVTGGAANALDTSDPSNRRSFVLGDTITVTLGSSGNEDVAVAVHDAGIAGPDDADASEDEPWLRRLGGSASTRGFVRFEWRDAFAAATGVMSSSDIFDASVSLDPQWGAGQAVLARRVLQSWSDAHGGDGDLTTPGAPTWAEHARGAGGWNAPGALAVGRRGDDPADYFGAFDVAGNVDATAVVDDFTQRTSLAGPGMSAAYRFWFDNPAVDMGHALELAGGTGAEMRFERSEAALGAHAPVLTLTYRLPAAPHPMPEISPTSSSRPLLVARSGADLLLSFADDAAGSDHEVFEGAMGEWATHPGTGCVTPAPAGGARLEVLHAPSSGNRYLLVGASSPCGGDLGTRSDGVPREVRFSACSP